MAIGDVACGLSSVAAGAYLDIRPAGTQEFVVHNIYHDGNVSIEMYDGSNSLVFDSETGAGAYTKNAFHCTNAQRIRVKNNGSASQLIGYDGVVTHL
jgi:hypothetical protein